MVSLGCPKNLVDSEVMLGLAQQAGHELTRDPAGAEVPVVNTCAFIDKAKQESVDAILEMAEFKKTGACKTLVVAGCLAERYRDELKAQIPEIDAILGTGDVPAIVEALGGPAAPRRRARAGGVIQILRKSGEAVAAKPGRVLPRLRLLCHSAYPACSRARLCPTYLYDAETPRLLATPRHYAYIKIAEGCDYKCGFCIIPKLRGHYRSRPHDSIVREAEALAARGVKELLLISQDTTFYGIDRGERGALARLLGALQQVDGIEWIRLLYLYPTTIGDDVLDAMADARQGVPLRRPAAAARLRCRLEADEAAGHARRLREAARPHPDAGAGRHAAYDGHRRLPRRDGRRLRRAAGLRQGGRVRPPGRLHLLPRGGHVGPRPGRRRPGLDQRAPPRRR